MKKSILIILLSTLIIALPAMAVQPMESENIEIEDSGLTVSVSGSQVRILDGEGLTLEIYNLAGVRVTSVYIDSYDKTINLKLNRGCYILKVGKVVRKISIR